MRFIRFRDGNGACVSPCVSTTACEQRGRAELQDHHKARVAFRRVVQRRQPSGVPVLILIVRCDTGATLDMCPPSIGDMRSPRPRP
jgi:hypothetical protein